MAGWYEASRQPAREVSNIQAGMFAKVLGIDGYQASNIKRLEFNKYAQNCKIMTFFTCYNQFIIKIQSYFSFLLRGGYYFQGLICLGGLRYPLQR